MKHESNFTNNKRKILEDLNEEFPRIAIYRDIFGEENVFRIWIQFRTFVISFKYRIYFIKVKTLQKKKLAVEGKKDLRIKL